MTRDEAKKLLECNLSELASKLGITTAAVAKWNKDQIPKLREYEIRDIFAKSEKAKKLSKTLGNSAANKNIQN